MDELRIIVQLLQGLGDISLIAFIWWLVLDKLVPGLLVTTCVLTISGVIYHLLRRALDHSMAKLRDAMGVGSPGPLTDSEVRSMFEWVAEHRQLKP